MKPMTEHDFRALFAQHKNTVYQFAWRMTNCPATAEDIVQEVFLTLWRGEAEVDPARGSSRALLLGMARHFAWRHCRQDRRWTVFEDDTAITEPLALDSLDLQAAVSHAVAQLPALQREALILATYSELSLQEIAEASHAELGTIKARLHRARENLKRLLANYKPIRELTRRDYGTSE
ncbi:MAG: RNA polymerase sigma factor [Acidobacteriaceae bacterium]|nr:RNA polymerase sigma factor [Acidobacteriaceae bacterium]